MVPELDEFIKQIDPKFWKHITKKSLLPFVEPTPDRREFLTALHKQLVDMEYAPSAPRGHVISAKANGVVRFVPSLKLADYCVYYFCIKVLQNELAENRTPGTFGGFHLSSALRREENPDLYDAKLLLDPHYWNPTNFNAFGWVEAWSEYQTQVLALYQDDSYQWFGAFDIANFYDAIRLDQLEVFVRNATSSSQSSVVDLLFYFLRNVKRAYPTYTPRSQSLPQDEVGDCSRILANFYLQEYDAKMHEICEELGARYLRYADDQVIAAKDEKTAREILFRASKELVRYGLNLNAHKTRRFSRDAYEKYWAFDIMRLLLQDEPSVEEAFDLFEQRKNSGIEFRQDMVLRKLVGMKPAQLGPLVDRVYPIVMTEGNVTKFRHYHFASLYKSLSSPSKKKQFIADLNRLSQILMSSEFHLNVLKFAKEQRLTMGQFKDVTDSLKRLESL